jgi:hypothetical protein
METTNQQVDVNETGFDGKGSMQVQNHQVPQIMELKRSSNGPPGARNGESLQTEQLVSSNDNSYLQRSL